MKDYKFDYRRSSFKTIHKANKKIFYLQVNDQYVEVDEEVYKVCKASYDKIRYTHKVEVAKSVMYCDNMDLTTLFICDKAHDDIDKLYIHDLYQVAMNCIKELSKLDKIIAELSLIEEMSNYQIAELLNIPRTTITYKRNKIQNIFKKKQKNLSKSTILFTRIGERTLRYDKQKKSMDLLSYRSIYIKKYNELSSRKT